MEFIDDDASDAAEMVAHGGLSEAEGEAFGRGDEDVRGAAGHAGAVFW